VEFRADTPREISGDQIIEWRLVVGGREIELPDPRPRIRWTYGDPLRLELRWATDSPFLPLSRGLPVGARVDGVTVTWEHDDPWSLISFLQARRVRPDLDPHTLELEVTTRRASQTREVAWEDGETEPVRVFLRVRLLAPEGPGAGAETGAEQTDGDAPAKGPPAAAGEAGAAEGAAAGPLILPRFPFAAPRLQAQNHEISDLKVR